MDNVIIDPRVAVVGVGGAGCNVISCVYDAVPFAEAIAINTDRESLRDVRADKKLYICQSVTKGEGTKGDSVL
ncbi:MAG: cell division protein FtsZ, partial [Thermoplasmata archaeon]|nr:cell division protein FtsZ [Thermoplasmata archaeon]